MPISRIYTAASASRKKQALSYSKGESNLGPTFTYGKFNFDYSINFQGLKLGFEDKNGERNLLDIVTFCHPKFSLYGAASRGVITRFHKSEVYAMPPSVENYKEGLLRLEIENDTDEWAAVGRVVIYQKGLNLYYDETTVSACAKMIIRTRDVADVVGIDQPIREGMTQCLQVFEQRKTTPFCNIEGALLDTTFTMDMGMR